MNLNDLIERIRETDESLLDNLVIEAFELKASNLNNEGPEAQLLWLIANGYTPEEVLAELPPSMNEAARPVLESLIEDTHPEAFYGWRERAHVEGEKEPRWLFPWRDAHEHEFPMDWQFDTVWQALQAKNDLAPDEDWTLVRVEVEAVLRHELKAAQDETHGDK